MSERITHLNTLDGTVIDGTHHTIKEDQHGYNVYIGDRRRFFPYHAIRSATYEKVPHE